jgi:hypothetical protein
MSEDTRNEIIRHMSLAFFADAWASYSERVGPHYAAGAEILNCMPEDTDPAALAAAKSLADDMEKLNGASLTEIMARGEGGDRPCTPEFFGHYAAMHATGSGVGLESVGFDAYGPEANVKVPNVEFTMYDLDGGKYPIPEDLED